MQFKRWHVLLCALITAITTTHLGATEVATMGDESSTLGSINTHLKRHRHKYAAGLGTLAVVNLIRLAAQGKLSKARLKRFFSKENNSVALQVALGSLLPALLAGGVEWHGYGYTEKPAAPKGGSGSPEDDALATLNTSDSGILPSTSRALSPDNDSDDNGSSNNSGHASPLGAVVEPTPTRPDAPTTHPKRKIAHHTALTAATAASAPAPTADALSVQTNSTAAAPSALADAQEAQSAPVTTQLSSEEKEAFAQLRLWQENGYKKMRPGMERRINQRKKDMSDEDSATPAEEAARIDRLVKESDWLRNQLIANVQHATYASEEALSAHQKAYRQLEREFAKLAAVFKKIYAKKGAYAAARDEKTALQDRLAIVQEKLNYFNALLERKGLEPAEGEKLTQERAKAEEVVAAITARLREAQVAEEALVRKLTPEAIKVQRAWSAHRDRQDATGDRFLSETYFAKPYFVDEDSADGTVTANRGDASLVRAPKQDPGNATAVKGLGGVNIDLREDQVPATLDEAEELLTHASLALKPALVVEDRIEKREALLQTQKRKARRFGRLSETETHRAKKELAQAETHVKEALLACERAYFQEKSEADRTRALYALIARHAAEKMLDDLRKKQAILLERVALLGQEGAGEEQEDTEEKRQQRAYEIRQAQEELTEVVEHSIPAATLALGEARTKEESYASDESIGIVKNLCQLLDHRSTQRNALLAANRNEMAQERQRDLEAMREHYRGRRTALNAVNEFGVAEASRQLAEPQSKKSGRRKSKKSGRRKSKKARVDASETANAPEQSSLYLEAYQQELARHQAAEAKFGARRKAEPRSAGISFAERLARVVGEREEGLAKLISEAQAASSSAERSAEMDALAQDIMRSKFMMARREAELSTNIKDARQAYDCITEALKTMTQEHPQFGEAQHLSHDLFKRIMTLAEKTFGSFENTRRENENLANWLREEANSVHQEDLANDSDGRTFLRWLGKEVEEPADVSGPARHRAMPSSSASHNGMTSDQTSGPLAMLLFETAWRADSVPPVRDLIDSSLALPSRRLQSEPWASADSHLSVAGSSIPAQPMTTELGARTRASVQESSLRRGSDASADDFPGVESSVPLPPPLPALADSSATLSDLEARLAALRPLQVPPVPRLANHTHKLLEQWEATLQNMKSDTERREWLQTYPKKDFDAGTIPEEYKEAVPEILSRYAHLLKE